MRQLYGDNKRYYEQPKKRKTAEAEDSSSTSSEICVDLLLRDSGDDCFPQSGQSLPNSQGVCFVMENIPMTVVVKCGFSIWYVISGHKLPVLVEELTIICAITVRMLKAPPHRGDTQVGTMSYYTAVNEGHHTRAGYRGAQYFFIRYIALVFRSTQRGRYTARQVASVSYTHLVKFVIL